MSVSTMVSLTFILIFCLSSCLAETSGPLKEETDETWLQDDENFTYEPRTLELTDISSPEQEPGYSESMMRDVCQYLSCDKEAMYILVGSIGVMVLIFGAIGSGLGLIELLRMAGIVPERPNLTLEEWWRRYELFDD